MLSQHTTRSHLVLQLLVIAVLEKPVLYNDLQTIHLLENCSI